MIELNRMTEFFSETHVANMWWVDMWRVLFAI